MNDFTRVVINEIDQFISAPDKREYIINLCEDLFDEFLVPIDLPGPDAVIDPLLRSAVRPVVGRIYDEILKKIKSEN